MQAIILAGGLGTRLRSVVADVPKPMAPINGKPFLAYLIEYLKLQGITSVILSVHYLREKIQDYFQENYSGIPIDYSIEEEALGTGGAIVQSLQKTNTTQPVFVLNGDTFLKIDYQAMYQQHALKQASLTLALRRVNNCGRYGELIADQGRAIRFKEQGSDDTGFINAGVYLLSHQILSSFQLPTIFSFERDFLFPQIPHIKPHVFEADSYFIDIGVPEDYAKAVRDLGV